MALDPKKWEPVESTPAPVMIPPPPIRTINPYLRTTLPNFMQLQTDMVKQQYTTAIPQIRVMPLQSSAHPQINAAAQNIATHITQQAISQLPPPPAPSVGDSLVHGDAVWESDTAYVSMRDDFLFVSGSGNAINAPFNSELPWYYSGPNAQQFAGAVPNLGNFLIPNNSTANGAALLSPVGPQSGSSSYDLWPLLDYPPWKLTWVFTVGRPYYFNTGSLPTVAFNFSKTSLYIGLGANPLNVPFGTGSTPPRPPFFVGLRYDTDTTAPAISDSAFVFEAASNNGGMTSVARINTQGTTSSTGITPTEGVTYRLEILCTSAGHVTMTLFNGTTSATATMAVPTWLANGTNNFSSSNGIGIAGTVLAGSTASAPVGAGSTFTIASTGSVFDGSYVALGNGNTTNINFFFAGSHSSSGGSVSGNPALVPYCAFGNDTTASPTANSKALLVDFFSFIWNPKVGGGTGTPNSMKSRYF